MRTNLFASLLFLFIASCAFGQITTNTNFDPRTNQPVDVRDTLTFLADTSEVTWTFPGLISYAADVDQFWYYNGSYWERVVQDPFLANLQDVDTADIATDDFLQWNGTSWVPSALPQDIVEGIGLVNYLAFWDTDTTITDANISYSLTILDASGLTGALVLPSGTDAQDPIWQNGMLRYNTTTGGIQGYNGAERYLPWSDAAIFNSTYIPYSNGSSLVSSSNLKFNGTELHIGSRDGGSYDLSVETGIYMGNGTFRIEGWNGDAQLYITAKKTANASLLVDTPDYAAARLKTSGTYTSTVIESAGGYPLTIYPEFSGNHNTKRGTIKFSTRQFYTGCCGDIMTAGDEGGYRMFWEAYRQIGGWVNLGYIDVFSPPAFDASVSSGVMDFVVSHNNSYQRALSLDGVYEGVGIYTDDPTAVLDVNGNTRIRTLQDSVAAYITTADASGYLYRATAADIVAAGGLASGAISTSTDGSGDVVVSHGLGVTPTSVQVTVTGTTPYVVTVHTIDATNFTVRFFDMTGAAVTSTAVTATWHAKT